MKTRTIVLTLAIMAGCKTDPVIISGQGLDMVGQDFVQVSAFITGQYQAGKVTDQQYATWERFGRKFQVLYPTAMDLWIAAADNQDALTQQHAMAIITNLGLDLVTNTAFLPDAQRLIHSFTGGTP